jgi:glycosyltransferase involved in cell wall biosynthesis
MSKSINNSSMWDVKPIKLSILVPTRNTVDTQFAYSLTQLMVTTREAGIDAYLFFDSSTILLNQRNNLIKMAKEVKSDYILWIDSDMMFPPTAALRLLEHNKDIVACNYMTRSKPLKTVAYRNLNDWDSWVPLELHDELIKVEGVGMGCMLMKMNIFDSLEKPYFEFQYKEDTEDYFGEDFILLTKLREKGYDVFIDTHLSIMMKHIGIYAF